MHERLDGISVILSLALLTVPMAASASTSVPTRELTLASISDQGVKANANNFEPVLSGDGTRVAFESYADNLDPADTDGSSDVFVMDLATGDLILASASSSGIDANRWSSAVDLTDDGQMVAFDSEATNLHPDDPDSLDDVYLKNLSTGAIELVSTSATGVKGNDWSEFPAVTPDGAKIAFRSLATNFDARDHDAFYDIYVKDVVTGDLTLASTSDAEIKGNNHSFGASISADGTKVAFHSRATNLDPADTERSFDVYVKDLVTGDLVLVSVAADGRGGNGESYLATVSTDGTAVAFTSTGNNFGPVDDDEGFTEDVYLRDLVSGEVTLVSTSDSGVKGNYASSDPTFIADGTKVAFQSAATNLDPLDPNDTHNDIFVKDLLSGEVLLTSTTAYGIKGNEGSGDPFISSDGSTVTFYTVATTFDPIDTDDLVDIYVKDLTVPDPMADLSAGISDSPDPVELGEGVTYTIEVTNGGPSAATGVWMRYEWSPSIRFLSVDTTQGTCKAQGLKWRLRCDLGNMASRGSATITVVLRATKPPGSVIHSQAWVFADQADVDPTNSTDTEDTLIV